MRPRLSLIGLLAPACSGAGLSPLSEDALSDGALLTVEPAGDVGFGAVPINGQLTGEKTLTLLSEGDEPVTIDDITLSAETPAAFWIDPELTVPFGVQPGESRTVTLYFQPDTVGSYTGEVQVIDGARTLIRRLIGQGCDSGSDNRCD